MLLGILSDLGHCLHRLHRVFSRGGFAGKHDTGSAVIDGVGHIGDLGTGRTGILDHGFQHLRGGDDPLAHHPADPGQLLLDRGNLHIGNLHTQIAPGDHDAAADGANILHIVHTGLVFNFCHDLNVAAAVGVQKRLNIQHVLSGGNKGCGNKVHPMPDTEQNIRLILLSQIGTGHDLLGEGHALAVAQLTADEALTDDIISPDLLHLKLHHTVIDGNHISGL